MRIIAQIRFNSGIFCEQTSTFCPFRYGGKTISITINIQ